MIPRLTTTEVGGIVKSILSQFSKMSTFFYYLSDSSLSQTPPSVRPKTKTTKKNSLLWLERWPVYMMVILYIFPTGFQESSRVKSKTHVLFNLVTQISLSYFISLKVLLHFHLCISLRCNQIRANHQEGQNGPRKKLFRGTSEEFYDTSRIKHDYLDKKTCSTHRIPLPLRARKT